MASTVQQHEPSVQGSDDRIPLDGNRLGDENSQKSDDDSARQKTKGQFWRAVVVALRSFFRGGVSKLADEEGLEYVQSDEQQMSDEEKLRKFVEATFACRECNLFVPSEKDDKLCGCGHNYGKHDACVNHLEMLPNIDAVQARAWTPRLHTKLVKPTTSFGQIEFNGFGNHTEVSPYVRVDHDTDVSQLWTLLITHWKLPVPKLVISVTGGARQFSMKNRLREAFKRGIINAACSTGAWIITAGTGEGVMKYTGEALAEYSLQTGLSECGSYPIAIGICPWGVVENSEVLENAKASRLDESSSQQSRPNARYHLLACSDDRTSTVILDHNHTHFIFVDDGSHGHFGTEIELRSKLEKFISQRSVYEASSIEEKSNPLKSELQRSQNVRTPVVIIACEGGKNTLKQITEGVERKVPTVVIKGSGRMADVIARAYLETRGITHDPEKLATAKEKLRSDMRKTDRKLRTEQEVDAALNRVFWLVEEANRDLITVYEMDDENNRDMDRAILQALLKAKTFKPQEQLQLALIWNRPDIAREEIFKPENLSHIKELDLDNSITTALVKDRSEFVRVFLDNGVDTKSYLTLTRLNDLYEKCLKEQSPTTALITSLIKKTRRSKYLMMRNPLKTVLDAKNRVGSAETLPEFCTLRKIGRVIVYLLQDTLGDPYEELCTGPSAPLECPERDLFIWAILLNRKELAEFFWRSGKDQIGAALTAAQLANSLSNAADKFEEDVELSADFLNHSEKYEKLACGIISTCYQHGRERAHRLLVRAQPLWGSNMTLFSIAAAAQLMDFMQTGCCQSKLNSLWWTGKLTKTGAEAPRGFVSAAKQNKRYLYLTSPRSKFIYHVISSLVFLCLVSFVSLTRLPPLREYARSRTIQTEICIWIWGFTLLCEEIHQIAKNESESLFWKIFNHYHRNFFNFLDTAVLTSLIVCVILRFEEDNDDDPHRIKVPYAICMLTSSLRLMSIFYCSKAIGPKVVMIQKMFRDLVFFLTLLLVFIVGFGVAIQALLFPRLPFAWSSVLASVYTPYWQVFGDLFLERAEGRHPPPDQCSSAYEEDIVVPSVLTSNLTTMSTLLGASNNSNTNLPPCSEPHFLVPLFSAIYMMLTNVLLMNLLIAMFSYTFERVQENSEKVWRFNRYFVVCEYFERPALMQPFVLFGYIATFISYVYRKYWKKSYMSTSGFLVVCDTETNRQLSAFEKSSMEEYLFRTKLSREGVEAKLTFAQKRLDRVIEDLDLIKEQLQAASRPVSA